MDIEFLELDNLLETECQAVVIPANTDLWINSKLGQDLLVYGGDQLEVEAMAQAPVALGEAIATSAGNLENLSLIIHAIVYGGPRWFPAEETLEQATFQSFVIANEYAIESLALPILGEVNRKATLVDIARAMWQGLQRFLKDYPENNLKMLKIVIEDEETLDQFFDAFAAAQEQATDV